MKPRNHRTSLFAGLFALMAIPCMGQSEAFGPQLDSIFQAFRQRDYAFLAPLLTPEVVIGQLPTGLNDLVIPQVLAQLPEPLRYVVDSTVVRGGDTRIHTTYFYADGNARPQVFTFDARKRVTELDVLQGAKAYAIGETRPVHQPDRIEVPFELHADLIFVKVMLNGKEETMILDSGAPVLVMNADRQGTEGALSDAAQAHGVGGSISVGATHVDHFDWQGLRMENFDAMSMSLGHLEQAAKRPFAGLIGHSVFQDYEITFDYGRRMITLVRTDEAGEPVVPAVGERAPVSIIPFTMEGHIPAVRMTVDGVDYVMGLDCGATSNLIHLKHEKALAKRLSRRKRDVLAGAGKATSKTFSARLDRAWLGTTIYEGMVFSFDAGNIDRLNEGYSIQLDGLLGYPLLKQYPITLNFRKGELRIHPLPLKDASGS